MTIRWHKFCNLAFRELLVLPNSRLPEDLAISTEGLALSKGIPRFSHTRQAPRDTAKLSMFWFTLTGV
jgi:hypothetical protein